MFVWGLIKRCANVINYTKPFSVSLFSLGGLSFFLRTEERRLSVEFLDGILCPGMLQSANIISSDYALNVKSFPHKNLAAPLLELPRKDRSPLINIRYTALYNKALIISEAAVKIRSCYRWHNILTCCGKLYKKIPYSLKRIRCMRRTAIAKIERLCCLMKLLLWLLHKYIHVSLLPVQDRSVA